MSTQSSYVELDIPNWTDLPEQYPEFEENSITENPLAREFAIKFRKVVAPELISCSLEKYVWVSKEPRVTKREKRNERERAFKKSPYSVYEDMVIINNFAECQEGGYSMNETFDFIMEELTERTFESVRERYRKWLKDLCLQDKQKIIEFCNQNYVTCGNFMLTRKLNPKTKLYRIDDFVPINKKPEAILAGNINLELEQSPVL